MNLLFAINKGYIRQFIICMKSICLNAASPDGYRVYILHSDLDGDDFKLVRGSFKEEAEFEFILVDEDMFRGFPESKRYPKQIYYRIAAPLLLGQDMDRILYLDADIVVINPLTKLYSLDFEGAYYMACTHTRRLLNKFNQARLRTSANVPYINTGVMMFNLPLLRENLDMERVRGYAGENKNRLMLPDQDIITALYGDRIKLLDSMVYNLSDRVLALYNADPKNPRIGIDWVRKNSVIIHYFGKSKPWTAHYVGILDVFYNELTEKIKNE